MKQKYFFLVLLFFTCSSVMAQSIFDNPITGSDPGTINPYITGQNVNSNITVSGIGHGTGAIGQTGNDRYNLRSWNTNAIDLTAYFEFTLTPNSGKNINFISFVYTGQASNNQINGFAFRSSIDGFTADIGTVTEAGATVDLSASTYQNISSAITFRFYAWGASSANSTYSINDFTFNGITGVLPITVEYFNGTRNNGLNVLDWKVNCTSAAKVLLSIERSADGNNFTSINNINADAVRCLQPFDFTDNNPLPGYNYYRLKMADAERKITYSNKVVLLNKESGFEITGLFPSVVNSNTSLNITAAQNIQLGIVVTDLTGRVVQKNNYNLVAGYNKVAMNLSGLAPGSYQVTGYTDNEKAKTIRFIKQ
ncbi:T9SS type A sorting domain-containing protein [Ferruginibacter sp. SUN106]|uniref:T9SS type A sorting domain-containing protein n=1 Tax=Ferruginibacter sp. SUN106 TaxID=2978348 RepID=UPI003D36EDB9